MCQLGVAQVAAQLWVHAALLLRERAALDLRLRSGALFLLPASERDGATFLPLALHALAQRLHEVDDVSAILAFCRWLDCLACRLALHELAQRQLVFVFEL